MRHLAAGGITWRSILARLYERHWHVTRVRAAGGCTGRLVDLVRDVLAPR
ncbi:hypothetical protein ACFYPN_25285 [Streptomyces sp. NPDC005576]